MTTIYLIRHGEAEGNIFRRLHGQYDSLLTPRGHRQLTFLEKRFETIPVDGCFASDLTRASLTARAVTSTKALILRRDCRFREVDVGIWEDLPYGWLDNFEEESMWNFNHNPLAWHTEGAEEFDTYTQRFLEGMQAAAERFDGGTIAIVGHGAVIRGTLMRLFFWNDLEKMPLSDNTGISKLCYDKGRFTYDFLNDNSHIPEELSTFYIQHWWRSADKRKEAAVWFRETGDDLIAMLIDRPVGRLHLGKAEGKVGVVLGMELQTELDGRYYGDQLLGEAFSRFRKQGCTALRLEPGQYPDDLFRRYEFDPMTRCRNIDTGVYDWRDCL